MEGLGHLAYPALTALAVVLATTATPVKVGLSPCAETPGLGSLWVANYASATVTRVDPATNRATGTVKVGAEPCGMAAGAGAIWVDGFGTGTVERIDPVRMRRVATIPAGPGVWDVAFDGRSVWADDNYDGTVVRIDPATNRVVQRIHTGGSPTGLAVSNGSLWVGSNGATDRRFFRISLRTGRVTTVVPGCLRPAYFAVHAGDDPWVTCVGDGIHHGSALRIDPKTNRVVTRLPVGRDPGDGAIDDAGRVWIPNKGDGTVSRIDPATDAVAETVPVGGTPFVTIAAFGDVWVPDYAGATIDRLS